MLDRFDTEPVLTHALEALGMTTNRNLGCGLKSVWLDPKLGIC